MLWDHSWWIGNNEIIAPQMKKEWQIIDFNNYEDKLLKLVGYGDSVESKIKVQMHAFIINIERGERRHWIFQQPFSKDS